MVGEVAEADSGAAGVFEAAIAGLCRAVGRVGPLDVPGRSK